MLEEGMWNIVYNEKELCEFLLGKSEWLWTVHRNDEK